MFNDLASPLIFFWEWFFPAKQERVETSINLYSPRKQPGSQILTSQTPKWKGVISVRTRLALLNFLTF